MFAEGEAAFGEFGEADAVEDEVEPAELFKGGGIVGAEFEELGFDEAKGGGCELVVLLSI